MDREKLKSFIAGHESFLAFIYRLFGRNIKRVRCGNSVYLGNSFMKNCTVSITGKGNTVEIEPGLTRLNGCCIIVSGSGCRVRIGSGCNLVNACIVIEDDGGFITLGKHVTISAQTELAAIEGTGISIGDDCLFSGNIAFRTGDSHSILDVATMKRLNKSQDIVLGDHVWVGTGVKVLKGVHIGHDSIVAAGAVISSGDYPANSIIGGIGRARVLESGVTWTPQRV